LLVLSEAYSKIEKLYKAVGDHFAGKDKKPTTFVREMYIYIIIMAIITLLS